jgi:thioredoxin-related protein
MAGETMKTIVAGLIVAAALFSASAEESQWLTDFPKAEARAKAEKKMVMLDFTGSDWCPACIKLRKEVFSKPEFAKYAQEHLVLVEVDFPQTKIQSEELKKANQALAEKFKVDEYPTVIILNSAGEKAGEADYDGGGPKKFIETLEKLRKKS